jgi:hypothetical protein
VNISPEESRHTYSFQMVSESTIIFLNVISRIGLLTDKRLWNLNNLTGPIISLKRRTNLENTEWSDDKRQTICISFFFVLHLTMVTVTQDAYYRTTRCRQWTLNYNGHGRKRSWPNLTVIPRHLPEGNQDSPCPSRDSNGAQAKSATAWTNLPIKSQCDNSDNMLQIICA